MSEYYMSHSGSELDEAISKVKNGYILPTGTTEITKNGSHDVSKYETAIVSVPAGVDTSDATADDYDIYYDKIAYANGLKVAGKYRCTGQGAEQWSANSNGCSASELRIPCEFKPSYVSLTYQSSSYVNGTVICAWFSPGAAVTYHSKMSSSPYVVRVQKTSDVDAYFYYDETNKEVVIKRPSSSYSWSTNNYKVFCFR